VLTKDGKIADAITGVAPDKNVEQALEAVKHLKAKAQ
jgi:peroxiredoxin